MGSKGKWAAVLLASTGLLAVVILVAADVRRVASPAPRGESHVLSAYELRLATWLDEPLGGEPGCGGGGAQPRRERR